MKGPSFNVITLIVASIGGVILTWVLLVAFIYFVKSRRALSTNFPWCFSDWKCNAPPTGPSLNIFNATHPEACSSSGNCVEAEAYNATNVYLKDQLNPTKPRCQVTSSMTDTDVAIVNKKTGILCKTTANVPCTISDLNGGNVEGCNLDVCGKMARSCATFKVTVPTEATSDFAAYYGYGGTNNAVIMDPTQWKCDSSAVGTQIHQTDSSSAVIGTLYELCSYGNVTDTPADVKADDFYNAFIFRYNKPAPTS